jgi:hypothetical protein
MVLRELARSFSCSFGGEIEVFSEASIGSNASMSVRIMFTLEMGFRIVGSC